MLVFWKARLVLLAVPKTGSTALERALLPHADAAILNPPAQKHCTVARWRSQLRPFFEQRGARRLELVAVMREPVDWLGSWHRYRARPELDGTPRSTAGMGLEDFVAAWLRPDPPEFARVGRQSRFLAAGPGGTATGGAGASGPGVGGTGVDHLFRHDRPGALQGFLEARLGVPVEIGRHNVSPSLPSGGTGGVPGAPALGAEMAARLRREAPEEFALWERLTDAEP